jgi:hypothetical protein
MAAKKPTPTTQHIGGYVPDETAKQLERIRQRIADDRPGEKVSLTTALIFAVREAEKNLDKS